MVDSKLIETFLKVVKYMNITKAADSLYLSQSTVSYRLNMLEKQVGVILIEREKGNKGLKLTQRGKEFAKLAKDWAIINEEITKYVNEQREIQELRIAAPDSLNKRLLLKYESLQKNFLTLSLIINTVNSNQVSEEVLQNRADLGFGYFPDDMSNSLIKTKMMGKCSLVVLKKNKNKIFKKYIDISELDKSKELKIQGITYKNKFIDNWIEEDISKTKITVVDSPSLLKNIMQEESWCLIPESFSTMFSSKDNLYIYHLNAPEPSLTWYMIYKRTEEERFKKFITMF